VKSERMTIRVSSAWEKSLVFGPQGTRNFGSEVVEVDSPMPELPWEMQGINNIVNSLSNIHIATRTHETGYLAQLASTLIVPQIARKQVPQQAYE
jgi:hypothetical protein